MFLLFYGEAQAFCGISVVSVPFRGKNTPRGLPCREGRARKALSCRMAAGCGMFRLAAIGLQPQCERVLPDPLTQAACFPACAGKQGQRKGFQDGSVGHRPLRRSAFALKPTPFQCLSGPCLQRTAPFFCLVSPSFAKDRAFYNAPFGPCLQCSGFSARCCSVLFTKKWPFLSAPGREGRAGGIHFRRKQGPSRACAAVRTACPVQTGLRATRAKAMSQAEFISAVSKARVVHAPQSVQRVLCRRAFAPPGRRQCHRRNSFPP